MKDDDLRRLEEKIDVIGFMVTLIFGVAVAFVALYELEHHNISREVREPIAGIVGCASFYVLSRIFIRRSRK